MKARSIPNVSSRILQIGASAFAVHEAADDDRDLGVARRDREHDALRSAREVALEDLPRAVLPGRLDHDLDPLRLPVDVPRGLRVDQLDRAIADEEGVSPNLDRLLEPAVDRVEPEEVLEGGGLDDVHDRDHLDVVAPLVEDPEDVAADPAEPHEADAGAHARHAAHSQACRRVSNE
jgi:hypothetical protein